MFHQVGNLLVGYVNKKLFYRSSSRKAGIVITSRLVFGL